MWYWEWNIHTQLCAYIVFLKYGLFLYFSKKGDDKEDDYGEKYWVTIIIEYDKHHN